MHMVYTVNTVCVLDVELCVLFVHKFLHEL